MTYEIVIPVIIAFAISALLGPVVIPFLRKLKVGQTERKELESHLKKNGTPTMGGIMILASIIITSLFYVKDYPKIIPILFMTVGFGVIGFLDDYLKVVLRRSDGLLAWQKMILQIIVTGVFAVYMVKYSGVALTMLIPFQTIMMPLMQEMNQFGKFFGIPFKDSLGGLIFMYVGFGAGMGVFLFHGFIKSSVPVSLEEAAIIDGCNTWQLFWRIVFPILKSITVTVIILDVIWIWNDYLLPSLTLTSIKNKTIPLAMSLFFGQYTIEWNMAMAALTFTIIPVIIFYLLCQKHIIKGVAAGAEGGTYRHSRLDNLPDTGQQDKLYS